MNISNEFDNILLEDFKTDLADVVEETRDNLKNVDAVVGKINDDTKDAKKYMDKHTSNGKSIVARAKNSICQFPVYISQTIRVNEAQIIANMFERYYTTLVQAVIAQNPIISEEEANNLLFLKHFHTNLNESAKEIYSRYNNIVNQYYECIDEFDKVMSDSIFYTQHLTESCDVVFRVVPTENTDLIFESHRLANEPLTGFTYLKEADEGSHNPFQNVRKNEVNETSFEKVYLSEDEIERIILNVWHTKKPKNGNGNNTAMNNYESRKANLITCLEHPNIVKNAKLRETVAKLNLGYDGRIFKYVRKDRVSSTTSTELARSVDAPTLLRDKDIKKINNLDPYSMVAEFRIKDKNGDISATVKYVIGVKTILHPIRTQDLSEELNELVTGNVKRLQKVRYKTGEISLMDYLFNIKGLKADASKNLNGNKRWINTLKHLGEYKATYGTFLKKSVQALNGGNTPIPNGTLILSQPDVTTLTNETGIDLSVASNAKKLANNLFLISVAIVDSSAGTIKILFPDQSSSWDIQSLASIDAEVSKTDNSQLMKELNRIVNK